MRGRVIAVIAVALMYQCAEITSTARGRGDRRAEVAPQLGVPVVLDGVHRAAVPEERGGHHVGEATAAYRGHMAAGSEPNRQHDHRDHTHRDHSHGVAAACAGARHQRPLFISFVLILAFLVVQVVVGILTDSLALLSDAGHMATDALGLGMALAAIQAASTARDHPQRTFGLYRLEILAALANAVLLFGVAG